MFVSVPPKLGPFTFGELVEGVRTQVQCVVQSGDPPLTLTWLKDGTEVSSDLGVHITKDDFSSTLAIKRVGLEHSGDYTCVAANAAKSTKLSSRLTVSGIVWQLCNWIMHCSLLHMHSYDFPTLNIFLKGLGILHFKDITY